MWQHRMGQNSNKMISTAENTLDNAVKQIEVLCESSTENAKVIGEAMKKIESNLKTLKSEKEFLIKMQKMEYSRKKDTHSSSKAAIHGVSYESQTDKDDELSSLSVTDTLQSKNDQLKKHSSASSISSVLTGARNILWSNKQEVDINIPPGTDKQMELHCIQDNNDKLSKEIKKLQDQLVEARKEQNCSESQYRNQKHLFEITIRELDDQLKGTKKKLNEKEKENKTLHDTIEIHETNFRCLKEENCKTVEKLNSDLGEKVQKLFYMQQMSEEANRNLDAGREELQSKIQELNELKQQVDQLESSIMNLQSENKTINADHTESVNQVQIQMQSLSDKNTQIQELERQLKRLENLHDIKDKTFQTLKLEAEDCKSKLEQKNADYSFQKQEMDTSIKKINNELMEVTKVKNELQIEVSKLEEEKTDMKLTIEKLRNDKETTDKNVMEEKEVLQTKIIELQAKEKCSIDQIALLQKENECLKTEKDRLEAKAKKKHISFHCVLKQPQSDQAVNGILDLLRDQYSDTDLEIVEESKRKKNTPLLVVLYNLSKIADDVKGALCGIEANSDVALVVLHSKEIKKPSEKMLTEPDFRKLGIIVDISFLSAKGIISNDVTEKAVHQLVGFLNKF